jgi:predicted XRE-type DNA-binding protein
MMDTPEPAGDESVVETPVCEQIMAELVKLRRRRKIGQEPIAKAIGITQARVSQMENLKGGLTLEAVTMYARAVGANIVVVPEKRGRRDAGGD